MKRLLLMGGRPWETKDGGQYFTEVLFRYFPTEIKLAFCNFAQPEADWPQTEAVNQRMFMSFRDGREISFRTMTPETFEEVSRWADIIYVPGGNPLTLLEKVNACGDVQKLWDGKVIAGSSAGADFFCTAFAYLQDKSLGKGLGWVKATCIPHWRDAFEDYTDQDWDWAEAASLKAYPDLPVLTIPEGRFVEFTVSS